MILPQTVEYAFRAVAYLATLPEGASASAPALADVTCVPQHYLSKVLRRLTAHGLLKAQRGQGGGFMLARPPERIRMLDVLRALDYAPAKNRCAFGWGACDPSHPCPLHPSWSKLNEAFLLWASTSTLADVGAMPTAGRRAIPLARKGSGGIPQAKKA